MAVHRFNAHPHHPGGLRLIQSAPQIADNLPLTAGQRLTGKMACRAGIGQGIAQQRKQVLLIVIAVQHPACTPGDKGLPFFNGDDVCP